MSRKERKTAAATVIALVLILGVSVTAAQAYFTTFTEARGSHTLELELRTEVHEDVEGLEKRIEVENKGDLDCYVRVGIHAGSGFTLKCAGESPWREGTDGYWYYDTVLKAGERTSQLTADIKVPEEDAGMDPAEFNVVVVQESTPAIYEADGNVHAEWNSSAERRQQKQ